MLILSLSCELTATEYVTVFKYNSQRLATAEMTLEVYFNKYVYIFLLFT